MTGSCAQVRLKATRTRPSLVPRITKNTIRWMGHLTGIRESSRQTNIRLKSIKSASPILASAGTAKFKAGS